MTQYFYNINKRVERVNKGHISVAANKHLK